MLNLKIFFLTELNERLVKRGSNWANWVKKMANCEELTPLDWINRRHLQALESSEPYRIASTDLQSYIIWNVQKWSIARLQSTGSSCSL